MAFTDAQRDKAIAHLNYPVLESVISLFTNRLTAVSGLSADAETRVIDILTTLETIETQLNSYRANAGVQVKTDGTVYYRATAIAELNSQYKYWQKKLSVALSININNSFTHSNVIRS